MSEGSEDSGLLHGPGIAANGASLVQQPDDSCNFDRDFFEDRRSTHAAYIAASTLELPSRILSGAHYFTGPEKQLHASTPERDRGFIIGPTDARPQLSCACQDYSPRQISGQHAYLGPL